MIATGQREGSAIRRGVLSELRIRSQKAAAYEVSIMPIAAADMTTNVIQPK